MAMIGFNFTKILVEKKKQSAVNVSVNSNLGIKNISDMKFPIDDKKSALRFEFNYVCKYEPDFASIEITGELIELQEKEFAKKVVEDWTKNKTLPTEIMTHVLNTALSKCNIEAIILSKEMGLPSPVPMPKISAKPKEGAKISVSKKDEKKKK